MKKGSSKGWIFLGVVLAVLFIGGGSLIGSYNQLVNMDEDVKSAYAQIDTIMQRRADLIPNAAKTAGAIANYEKDTFTQLAEARSGVSNASSPSELAEANEELNKAVTQLNVVVENYPELKANQNFIMLQDQLEGSENRVSTERKNYNDTVSLYNRKIKSFPTSILAGMFNFDEAEYFEADESAREAPELDFGI